MSDLTIRGLRKSFGSLEILKGIDLDIKSGEFIVFVGPSGCGKSTLLRCISGLEDITAGTLQIDGQDKTHEVPSKRGIAMVFQSYALYPHMSVRENIAYPLRLNRVGKAEIAQRVEQTARRLQLEALLDRLPRELSGGQRQRVAIGRAIVREPRVFLFDEPLSNLDAALRIATRIEIADLKKSLPDTTMIYVTHDQVEAMTLADRVVVLRDGLVEQVGTPLELYEKPKTKFVAGFIGSPQMNFVTGQAATKLGAHTVGVRPEHLNVEDQGQWTGTVHAIENLGSDRFVYVRLEDGQSVTARLNSLGNLEEGAQIQLAPEAGNLYLFDADGKPLAA